MTGEEQRRPPGLRAIVGIIAGFISYLLFARLATVWEFADEPISVFWPAAGVVVGVALVLRDQWMWVVIGATASHAVDVAVIEDASTRTLIATSAAQIAEWAVAVLIGVVILRPPDGLRRATRTTRWFLAGTITAAAIGAAIFSLGVDLASRDDAFRAWLLAHGTGIALGAPLVYAVTSTRLVRREERLAIVEFLASAGIAVALTVWSFNVAAPLAFLVLPAVAWLAIRFGLLAASPVAFVIASWATWRTSQTSGPLVDVDDAALTVQLFIGAIALTVAAVGSLALELDRQRRRFAGVLSRLPDAVLVIDGMGTVVEDYTFGSPGDGGLVGQRDVDLVTDDCSDEVAAARAEWLATGSATVVSDRRGRSSAATTRYQTRFARIAPDQAVAVARNVGEVERLEAEIRRHARRWRELMSASFEGLALVDRAGRITEANEQLAAIVAQPTSTLIGTSVLDLIPEERWPTWSSDIDRMRNGDRISAYLTVDDRAISIVLLPRLTTAGGFDGAIVVALDVDRYSPSVSDHSSGR
jgi:PAS domain S-box-containing protein